ncbi:hypothetical protein [Simkania sp.]|uniref:hypothetical protein n=1 Tax=Simkania sp. TaxID=34094 RepID=UPI003B518CCA
MSVKTGLPSLASLAAQTVLEQPEKCIQSYRKSSYDKFSVTVGQMTDFDLQRLKKDLAGLKLPESVLVYTTGSDAKLEKSNRIESPVEIVILCSEEDRQLVEKRVNTFVESYFIPMDEDLEWKPPSEDLSYCNCTKAVIPSRFMHKTALVGEQKTLDRMNEKFVSEVGGMSGSTRGKFRKAFVQRHTKQLNDVISGKESVDVNLVKGVISYSGKGRKATKYSLLRPIQYTLDLVVIDRIRNDKKVSTEDYAQLITEMPSTVPEQIQYLFDKGYLPKLSKQDVTDLQAAYKLGLFYFQVGQHLFSVSPDKVPISFSIPDKEELAKAYMDTDRILAKM